MARHSHSRSTGCRFVSREDVISDLTTIRLDDPEGEKAPRKAAPGPGRARVFRPWPPPGGLPPGQDPLAGELPEAPAGGSMLGLDSGDDVDSDTEPAGPGFGGPGSLFAGTSSGSAPRGGEPESSEDLRPWDRAVVSLNDEASLRAPLAPWPPPGGLKAEEDPFAGDKQKAIEEAFTPRFLRPGGARDIIGNLSSSIDPGRAAAGSVILHLLLVLFLLFGPQGKPRAEIPLDQQPDPLGLIAMGKRAEQEAPIPVQFYPAPGPKAKAPGKNPLPSDVDRQAHGGDPKLAKSDTPKAVSQPGIQELDPGKRGAPPKQVAEARPRGAQEPRPGPPEDAPRSAPDDPRSTQPVPSLSPKRPLAGIPASALQGLTSDQVAQVQRDNTGRGDGGDAGGGWDRDGGFVDQGPLSFDTQGYDWGNYAAEMIRKIKRNWEVPQLAYYGVKGRLTIRFFILKDGRVEGARILSVSGIPPYDNASLQAILKSNPFRPLPADLGKDREGVTITFLYNIRPDEARGH